jgi:hypothetical protein
MEGLGLGAAIGKALHQGTGFPYLQMSIYAAAFRLEIPLTVHVAIGTDVVHIHPSADGSIIGGLTYHDFKLFCALVASLEKGIYINLGSAVILPEVFLKALSAARNLGHRIEDFVTVNMDFIQHYNPECRAQTDGKGRKRFCFDRPSRDYVSALGCRRYRRARTYSLISLIQSCSS